MADHLGFCDAPSLSGNLFGPEGAIALHEALLVNGALTECNLIGNYMGEEGKASIRNAVQGKDGFKLHL